MAMTPNDFLKSRNIWPLSTVADMSAPENYYYLRELLEDFLEANTQVLKETEPIRLISFNDSEPEIGSYISLIWDNGSDCDCVYDGLDKSITPLPTHWRYINKHDNDNT